MITLNKQPDSDFLILNLSDPQLASEHWLGDSPYRRILEETVTTLVERVKPGLITVSGDISYAGDLAAYRKFADLIDSFGLPWAPVWGNHDNQDGAEAVDRAAELFLSYSYCVYEKGDPSMGNGNYVIRIAENGTPIAACFLMDSHDRQLWVNEEGCSQEEWATLNPAQLDWLRTQTAALKAEGCNDSAIILHIPIHAYRLAVAAAFRTDADRRAITMAESFGRDVWNAGYEDAFGVTYEPISSYPADDGVFDLLQKLGSIRHVVCGHNHINSTVINYQGIQLAFGLKTGIGSYFHPDMNGGTVLRVTGRGIADIWHEFVPIPRD